MSIFNQKEDIRLEKIEKLFKLSNKKNLLITGGKSSGKTTMVNKIIRRSEFIGIKTYAIWENNKIPKCIIMEDLQTGIKRVIAEPGIERMRAKKEEFDKFGVKILKKILENKIKNVIIDEIGYLEIISNSYCSLIEEIFEKKIVTASIRKENNKLIEKLKSRDDSFCIDIDFIDNYIV